MPVAEDPAAQGGCLEGCTMSGSFKAEDASKRLCYATSDPKVSAAIDAAAAAAKAAIACPAAAVEAEPASSPTSLTGSL